MILSAHQPSYLPWLGLIDKLSHCDVFVFMDDVNFSKNSFYARNKIKTNKGITTWLTVPVKSGSCELPIKDVRIDNNGDWVKRHWRLLRNAYVSAPFYSELLSSIGVIYEREWKTLGDLNWEILLLIKEWFGIETRIMKASNHRIEGRKSERILGYCKEFGAKTYVFGANGRNYYDAELFEKNNIEVRFQEFYHPTYLQQFGEFIPNLSFVDYAFNCGRLPWNSKQNTNILTK